MRYTCLLLWCGFRLILPCLVTLLVYAGDSFGQTARTQNGQSGLDFTSVRLASPHEEGPTATLIVEFNRNADSREPFVLEASVIANGPEAISRWFKSESVLVTQDQSQASIKLKLLADAQAPDTIVSDQVMVWGRTSTNRMVIEARMFPLRLVWTRAEPKPPAATPEKPSTAPQAEPIAPEAKPVAKPIPDGPAEVPAPDTSAAPLLAETPPTEPKVATNLLSLANRAVAPEAPETATAAGGLTADKVNEQVPWLEHLTLGPGDVLNFGLLGSPDLTRKEVAIAPDGRVSFLEAQDVMAAGLTVDELRQSLETELAKYRHAPRTLVSPVAFQSKKYFLLGQAVRPGVFTLDRPTTVIEAVARARGLRVGATEGRVAEMADLSRSFLARQGQRVEVDFEKLFLQGDLAQNVSVAPGDYLYFPAADLKEVYVLGEVKAPGRLAFVDQTTALRAIATRGGFSDKAWKGRVLVIRGSLNHPEAFVVDVSAVVTARAPDFRLEPRDIVYVSQRPWIRAEELLDAAASAFVQAAVIVWTGGHVNTLIH